MARRSSSKPLYELIMSGRDRGAPRHEGEPAEVEEAPEPAAHETAGGWPGRLTAGGSIRVPVGYLLLAVPVVIGIALAAYMLGSWQAARRVHADYDRLLVESSGQVEPVWAADDPTGPARAGAPRTDEAATPPGPAPAETTPAAPAEPRPQPRAAAPAGDPVETDPREPGLYYVVVAETRTDGARRLAVFLRERGLDAYVVSSHNPRLRRVILRPGFATRSSADPAVQRLLEEVQRVGRAWKTEYPFESDLSDAYLAP
jgi:cell division septation protein DedD